MKKAASIWLELVGSLSLPFESRFGRGLAIKFHSKRRQEASFSKFLDSFQTQPQLAIVSCIDSQPILNLIIKHSLAFNPLVALLFLSHYRAMDQTGLNCVRLHAQSEASSTVDDRVYRLLVGRVERCNTWRCSAFELVLNWNDWIEWETLLSVPWLIIQTWAIIILMNCIPSSHSIPLSSFIKSNLRGALFLFLWPNSFNLARCDPFSNGCGQPRVVKYRAC